MDAIDRKILAYVQKSGRDSYAEIGAAVGLSISAVNERLKKLHASGAIQHWSAAVDPKAVGRPILAFTQVLTAAGRADDEAAFLGAVRGNDAVLECHHVTGDWSYLLKIRAESLSALETLLNGIAATPGVKQTHTELALSSLKETSVVPLAAEGA
ncbi:Lrp/AsnC family transcriptional regulator [Blastochloris tepida]|uniref:AsnC family transcriptional regulator n=1 Tax=Blastochloris tepida TaxID=2233851 RepID=A0A348FVQ2_9HYPH|nr:Lrp/AsnC family transcriptional regulator [Blastochloris tepida]BBF91385.1 AsnC family transcriptional regulator [Blastochloris tepida]